MTIRTRQATAKALSVPGAMSLESRLSALEDRFALQELVSRFYFAVDDRRFSDLAGLFTTEGCFRYVNGSVNVTGREAIVEHFETRYSVLSLTNHVSHDHVIEFTGPGRACGLLASHVEVCRNGQAMVTATRYADQYEKVDTEEGSVWRFAERALSMLYYLPVADYARLLGLPNRNRGLSPGPADWFEPVTR